MTWARPEDPWLLLFLWVVAAIAYMLVHTGQLQESEKSYPLPCTGIHTMIKGVAWPVTLVIYFLKFLFYTTTVTADPTFENYDPPTSVPRNHITVDRLAEALSEVYDHGTQPNAFAEAQKIIEILNKWT